MRTHTLDFFDTFDPLPAREVALRAASMVGVPAEVLEAVRSVRVTGKSAADWLEYALSVNRGWRRSVAA